jgi:ankyrin repeat protein
MLPDDQSNVSPAEALRAAVCANDAARVSAVLEQYPALKSRLDDPLPNGAFGGTALLAAVHQGNRAMVDVLLRDGADVNARSHWWAGSFGVLDDDHGLASFLIERGASVDAHAAARLGMMDRLDQLVSANPQLVHARGGDGQTPLHFASSIAIAQYLLDRGADIDARDVDHESTPAQWMIRDRQEIARHLVTRGCRTDILMAAALGDAALVRKHLDDDPSSIRMSVSEECFPKQDQRSGGCIYIWTLGAHKTADLVAREFGHDDVFRLLMARSPDTLKLAVACELGDETSVDALLAAQPDLALSLTEGERRRVAVAAQNNDARAVRLMLDAGWPADVLDRQGATPLHWAAWNGNAEMTRTFLRHAPPLEVADDEHHAKPLGWAIYGSLHGWHRETGDYGATVDALLQAGAAHPTAAGDFEGSDAVRDALQRWVSRNNARK